MDYNKSALKVLDAIGGSGNIISVTHCATRLRFVIDENEKCDKDALEHIEGGICGWGTAADYLWRR